MSIITVRLIKSFEYRNVKNLVLRGLALDSLQVDDLASLIQEGKRLKFSRTRAAMQVSHARAYVIELNNRAGYEHFRSVPYDTLKLYVQPQGTKSQHLVINFAEDDALVFLSPACKSAETLASLGIKHETELSYFNWADYEKYKKDPKVLW